MVLYRTLADLDEKTQAFVGPELCGDERVLAGTTAAEADIERFRTRVLVTDRRLITAKRGWIRKRTKDIPLSNISQVETVEKGVPELTVHMTGDTSETFLLGLEDGREVVSALRGQLVLNLN